MSAEHLRDLFDTLHVAAGAEHFDVLVEGGGVLIERIVSRGAASPPGFWFDQERDEWVAVLRGRARIAWEDGRVREFEPGGWVFIPAHERHRVEWTSADPPCVWLAVHGRLK